MSVRHAFLSPNQQLKKVVSKVSKVTQGEDKTQSEERNKWGRRTSCNPFFFCPECGRCGLKTKCFNSLLSCRLSPLSLPERPPCVCACMCASGSAVGRQPSSKGEHRTAYRPNVSLSPARSLSETCLQPLPARCLSVCSRNEEYLEL